MKKFKFRITKTALSALLLIPFLFACQGDPKDSGTEMKNVRVVVGTGEFKPELQSDGKTWVFFLPLEFNQTDLLKTARVHFNLPKTATSIPGPGAVIDLNAPANFVVFAEDGSTFVYTIDRTNGSSNKAEIESFKLQIGSREIQGIIDGANSKISVHVFTTLLSKLDLVFPHFTASVGATVDSRSGRWQDFAHWSSANPIVCSYKVTSHDKTAERTWQVEIVEKEVLGDMLEYFETDADNSRTIFCEAVRRAGLENLIAEGDITCIVPNNNAWNTFLESSGVTSVDQLEPDALKSVLQYFIFAGDHRSRNLNSNNIQVTTLAGDPLWIRINAANQVIINDNVEELATPMVTAVEQDLWFENRVAAHVVSEFVVYKPIE